MTITAVIVISVMVLMMAGCEGSTFTTTSIGSKSTIEVNNAADGATGEGPVMEIGKNKTVFVTSDLEKGQLRIDFVEAVNMRVSADDPDDYLYGDIMGSVTVGPGDEAEITLEPGDYLYQFTAIGETGGKVQVNIG